MNHLSRTTVVAAGLATLLLAAPAAAANLVVNPSFETGDFSGWEQVNDTSFTSVEGEFGGISPQDGAFQGVFGPVDPGGGGIIQSIATVAGETYSLSFELANLGNPPNAFGLFWDGGFVIIDFDLEPFAYQSIGFDLVASGASTDLGFIFYHDPSYFLLDNIVLEGPGTGGIPEPATWAMMIAGFGLVGVTARRRRRHVAA